MVDWADLVADWGRNDAAPDAVALTEDVDVRWRCHLCGHEWVSTLAGRVKGGLCPGCAGTGEYRERRLGRARPDLAAEWHFGLNLVLGRGGLLPGWVEPGSSRAVWWVCGTCDHVWQATVAARVGGNGGVGTGCPACPVQHSREEAYLVAEIAPWVPVAAGVHKVHLAAGAECEAEEAGPSNPGSSSTGSRRRRQVLDVDVLIPAWRLVIEYDGAYWHADKVEADRRKTAALRAAGWRVLRLREAPLPVGEVAGPGDEVAVVSGAYGVTARAVLAWLMEQGYPVGEVEGVPGAGGGGLVGYLADPGCGVARGEVAGAAYRMERGARRDWVGERPWQVVSVLPVRPEQVAIPAGLFVAGRHEPRYLLPEGTQVIDWLSGQVAAGGVRPWCGLLDEHVSTRPLPDERKPGGLAR